MAERRAELVITASHAGDVRDIVAYLQALESAYNNLYALEVLITETLPKEDLRYRSRSPRRVAIKPIKDPAQVVLPEDRLRLNRVRLESPGFWAFLGALLPFETIRKWVADHHERKKDATFRNRQAEERGALNIERLRVAVAQKKIDLLKSAGVPEEQIRKALMAHLFEPLEALDRFQDAELIVTAEITQLEAGPADGSNKSE